MKYLYFFIVFWFSLFLVQGCTTDSNVSVEWLKKGEEYCKNNGLDIHFIYESTRTASKNVVGLKCKDQDGNLFSIDFSKISQVKT